jgi:flagellar hook assembly protein FlgD
LERINPNGASDGTNFHSAAESVNFATPAYQNSQYSLSTIFKGDVNIDPETFSPDNDGYQDLLNINYQFPEPGNVANVRIYDRKGRLIRDLINNELLGLKGTFKWDGITEDNNKARIGVYLIYFEVFNPNGEQKVYKKTAVLAGFLD